MLNGKNRKTEVIDISNKNVLISLTNFFPNMIFYFYFKVMSGYVILTPRCKRNSEKFIVYRL